MTESPPTHLDSAGQARMVDVTAKVPTVGAATAAGSVRMSPEVVAPLLKEELARAAKMRRADLPATLAEANLVDTFDTALWCGLVDFMTIHSRDDVRFTFKNGQEIRA